MILRESIIKILREGYSPAGKEITPNEIVVHKSNPIYRDKIMKEGLKVRAGECYRIYAGYGEKCIPAIFATNSKNKKAWFDSTYDDDIWFIDTTKIPDVKWFKDRHYESTKKHIVTFQNIPTEALTLQYEGTGRSEDLLENNITRSLNEETSLQKRVLNLINTKGLKQTSLYFGGIETISKILKMRPSVILSKYLHGKVFSINRSGYNIKFILKHIEDMGNEQFIFYYDVIEGTGNVTDGFEKLDILGLEIRMLDDWWNIKYEMKYLFRDFTEKLCDEYNFDYGDIDLDITSKKSHGFFI